MGAQVISLFQRPAPLRDWSQQELAEFYRVENALLQAGMHIETDRGVTDDGEPWFAFCRQDDGEVFIHFARIGGQYIIAGAAYNGVIKGWDFASLVRELIARHPLVQMGPARKPSNIFMHPAALLIAVVGTAFFKTGEAKADDGDSRAETGRRLMLSTSGAGPAVTGVSSQITVEAHQTMTLVAAAMAAATYEAVAGQTGSQAAWRLMDDHLAYSTSAAAISGVTAADLALPAREGGSILSIGASAQDLSDWLALTVVLSDVAAPDSRDTGAFAAQPLGVVFAEPTAGDPWGSTTLKVTAPIEASPANAAPAAYMVIELAAGPLPDVAAVRLVQAMGIFESAQVIRVAELPQFLADFIANGHKISVVPSDAAPPAVDSPAHDLAVPDVSTNPDIQVILDHTPVLDTNAVAAPPPFNPLPPTPAEVMTDVEVTEMIGRFVNSTPFTLISSGDDLIFYDTRIKDLNAHSDTYTLVMTFADGGTVTLIGMAHADYAFLLPGGG